MLDAYQLQPDFDSFVDKARPDTGTGNYQRLGPTLSRLGIRLDARTVSALIAHERGAAGQLLYSIKQAVGSLQLNLQVHCLYAAWSSV